MQHASRRFLAVLAVAFVTTLTFRVLATTALYEDALNLVELMRSVSGRPALWYHAAYLPIASLFEPLLDDGHELAALLWASAASAGLALALLTAAALRSGCRSALAALVILAAAISPGLWGNATRIEVHATQFLGAALLVWAVVVHGKRATRGTLLLLLAATAFAVTSHNSSLLALPGVVWAASAPSRDVRARVHVAVAIALGAALGWWINSRADVLPASTDSLSYLLTNFFVGPSWNHASIELVQPWFPVPVVLVAIIASRAEPWRALRAALPFIAAALPSIALFVALGIWTSGGYFTTGMALLTGAALVAAREPARSPLASPRRAALFALAIALPLTLLAAPRVHATLTDPLRLERARIGDDRIAAARSFMPNGGVVLSLELEYQSVTGRGALWMEHSLLTPYLAALDSGTTPEAFAAKSVADAASFLAGSEPVLIDATYEAFASLSPPVLEYMDALRIALSASRTFQRVEWSDRAYWLGE